VVEFYKKQPGLEFMGGGKESAMFKKGDVDITIQNPWMDMKSGKMMTDTLITILSIKEKNELSDNICIRNSRLLNPQKRSKSKGNKL